MKYATAAVLVLSLGAQGCIVNQPLGARDDGAAGDGAVVEDAAIGADASAPDAAIGADSAQADTGSNPDSGVVRDGGGGADVVVVADGATGNLNVRYVDLTVSTVHPIPALGAAMTSVNVSLRESAPSAGSTTVRELARSGDCSFKEVRPGAQVPPSLDGVSITATAAGRGAIALRRSSTGSSDNVLATYAIEISPALPVGATVRIDVGAIGTMPAFFREITVSDGQYAAPSPITDTASAR